MNCRVLEESLERWSNFVNIREGKHVQLLSQTTSEVEKQVFIAQESFPSFGVRDCSLKELRVLEWLPNFLNQFIFILLSLLVLVLEEVALVVLELVEERARHFVQGLRCGNLVRNLSYMRRN